MSGALYGDDRIPAMELSGTIHLVRHGAVENPGNVIYGRMPGFSLSERGRAQAEGAAKRLAEAPIGVVFASPLERAQETAAAIARPHGVTITTDERLLESGTTLEGVGRNAQAFLRSPRRWWSLRNPLRPSWGESFREIRARMLEVVDDAFAASGGRDVVIVSHQTPVLVTRLALAGRYIPPWLAFTQCQTGSVTSLTLDHGRAVSASYFVPPEQGAG